MKSKPLLVAVFGTLLLLVLVLWMLARSGEEAARPTAPAAAAPHPAAAADEPAWPAPSAAPHSPARPDELAALQTKVATLEHDLDRVVDSLNALIDRLDRETAAAQRARQPSWSANKATGEPDTMTAGDQATAWAPATMDGGPEWLQLGYEKTVEVAQVRVRETCGPGCITKVAAILENGQEAVIWQGRENAGEGIVDAPFNAPTGLTARGVKVYLDTKLVPGWNEIDAVELIGRDGSRQWAQTASASSSYAAGGTYTGRTSVYLETPGVQPAGGIFIPKEEAGPTTNFIPSRP